jgi:hypothetical protein
LLIYKIAPGPIGQTVGRVQPWPGPESDRYGRHSLSPLSRPHLSPSLWRLRRRHLSVIVPVRSCLPRCDCVRDFYPHVLLYRSLQLDSIVASFRSIWDLAELQFWSWLCTPAPLWFFSGDELLVRLVPRMSTWSTRAVVAWHGCSAGGAPRATGGRWRLPRVRAAAVARALPRHADAVVPQASGTLTSLVLSSSPISLVLSISLLVIVLWSSVLWIGFLRNIQYWSSGSVCYPILWA